MVKAKKVQDEVASLLRQHPHGITVRDMKDFRAKLSISGVPTDMLGDVLLGMRNRYLIEIKKQPDGTTTRVKPRNRLLTA